MNLRELQLVDTRLGAVGVAALAELPCVEGLRIPAVRHGRLGPWEVSPLLRHLKLAAGLRALDLRTNQLGGADLKVLGESFPELRVLDLSNNPLNKAALAKLVAGEGLGQLRCLRLQDSNITDDMVGALAKSRLMGQLRVLDLRRNMITDAGAATLLRAKNLSALRVLFVGRNNLTAGGKTRLSRSKALARARVFV